MLLIYIFWLIVGFLIYSNFQIELSKLLLYNLHLKKFFNVPDLYAAVGYTLLQTIHSMTLKAVIALRTIDEAISLVYWFKCSSRSMCAQIWWFSDTSPSCTLLNNRMTSKSNRCTFLRLFPDLLSLCKIIRKPWIYLENGMVTHTLFFRILTLWLNFQYFWKSDNGSELRNFSIKSIRIYTVCAQWGYRKTTTEQC